MFPLDDKDSKENPNNDTPISILQILSKLLERHISGHLLEVLTVRKLAAGFCPSHACKTALHLIVDQWLSHIHNHQFVSVLFVDFGRQEAYNCCTVVQLYSLLPVQFYTRKE